jgi:hypothetical protein
MPALGAPRFWCPIRFLDEFSPTHAAKWEGEEGRVPGGKGIGGRGDERGGEGLRGKGWGGGGRVE